MRLQLQPCSVDGYVIGWNITEHLAYYQHSSDSACASPHLLRLKHGQISKLEKNYRCIKDEATACSPGPLGFGGPAYGLLSFFFRALDSVLIPGENNCAFLPQTQTLWTVPLEPTLQKNVPLLRVGLVRKDYEQNGYHRPAHHMIRSCMRATASLAFPRTLVSPSASVCSCCRVIK